MTDNSSNTPYRKIPSLDALLREEAVQPLIEEYGREFVVAECRETLDLETKAPRR